jgi:hypothetical protein
MCSIGILPEQTAKGPEIKRVFWIPDLPSVRCIAATTPEFTETSEVVDEWNDTIGDIVLEGNKNPPLSILWM